jgi:hypothetical protein
MSDLQPDIPKELAKPLVPTESSGANGSPLVKRPTSITVISWFFILISFFEDFKKSLLVFNVDLLGILFLAYGLGMLNRQNWARLLYLWLTPLFWVWSLISGAEPAELFLTLMIYAVCLRLLTRPIALAYFKPTRPA